MAGIIATRVICLADERVNLRRPRRIDPVNESPRPVMSGSFTKGTVHLTGLTHLAFRLSSTVFVGCLPRHTLPPLAWSRGFHRASGTTQPSDDSWNTASHFACAYRVTSLGVSRGSQEPSWGHAQIFRTVPSANTLVRWVNEKRLRLHSAGSTLPHLWPTGSSLGSPPSTTARYFSAYPSDPASRRTPCPPKHPEWRLQVRLGCVRLSPACPFRRLHTYLSLRPARHYPRFWIRRPSSERRRDLNPPDLGAAQRTL
jgi:hypothetical protein